MILTGLNMYLKQSIREIYTGHWQNGYSVRQWPVKPRFTPRSSYIKDTKIVLDAFLFNNQHHGTDQGESGAIQEKDHSPSLHLDVVAIEKGDLGSPYGRQLYFLLIRENISHVIWGAIEEIDT